MKTYDIAELAVRNLRESILCNSLTTIGISIGVASLVAMLSLGIGLQQLAGRHLQNSGLLATVVVASRRDLRSFNREQEENGPAPAESPALDENARQKIAQLPNVLEAYPDLRFITELRYDDKPYLTVMLGLPFSAKNNDAFDGMQGSFFSSDAAPEVIAQKSFAAQLLGKAPKADGEKLSVTEVAKLLGKQLTMRYAERTVAPVTDADKKVGSSSPESAAYSVISREVTLTIVGICDVDPDNDLGYETRIFLPLKLAQNLHMMQPSDLLDSTSMARATPVYPLVEVHVQSHTQVQPVEDAIKKMGFNTFTIGGAASSLRQFFAVVDLFLGIFGSLALAVASVGIINTLVMATLERRREIGIMKAIGASDRDVKGLFFAEAGVMGVFGGFVGVGLGWTIGRVINLGTNVHLRRQHFPPEQIWFVPWWLVIGAIAFAIVVSVLSALYPASRAARLDPVQALRYE
jgi:putative ABC transport system permease protein